MRSIFIGDVHGCADELDALLDRLAVAAEDRVYFVGDLVVRGPHPHRVVETARRIGAQSVRGNHEHRLLSGAKTHSRDLDRMNDAAASALDDDDWHYLRAMPLWLDVPEHDVRIVHAGVMPGTAIADQRERDLLFLRGIDDDGNPVMRRGEGTLWGARYEGPPHVVFGHHALSKPQLHAWATGLDTGCVYGGTLTALVLDDGEPVPPPEERKRRLVVEKARALYAST